MRLVHLAIIAGYGWFTVTIFDNFRKGSISETNNHVSGPEKIEHSDQSITIEVLSEKVRRFKTSES